MAKRQGIVYFMRGSNEWRYGDAASPSGIAVTAWPNLAEAK